MTVQLRAAQPTDAGTTGDILWRFMRETEWMPKLYSAAEIIGLSGAMIDRGWVTVALIQGRVVGFIARDNTVIHALYLAPDLIGHGIGKLLLDDAKSRSDALDLWTFQASSGAQRFYLRESFVEQGRTDGSRNEENLADIHYVWARKAATI